MNQIDIPLPPHSIEAEQSIIGSLLLDNLAIDRIVGMVNENDFYREDHRLIWRHIVRIIGDNNPADVVTVAASMENDGTLDEAGGLAYLSALALNTPSSANIRKYAEIVREKWQARKLLSASWEIADLATSQDIKSAIGQAQAKLSEIAEARTGSDPRPISDALPEFLKLVESAHESEQGFVGLPTHLKPLDKKLGGLKPGQLIILAGRPAMGKAQPLDSNVLMADGSWKDMGSIRLGDVLASVDGSESVVSGVFPQGDKEIFKITFSDGRSTRACGDHLWEVKYRDWIEPRIVSTEKIKEMLSSVRYQGRLSVRMVSGEFGTNDNVPVDPYVLGVLLGDGNITGATPIVSTADIEIIEELKNRLGDAVVVKKVSGKYEYSLSSKNAKLRLFKEGCLLKYPRRYPHVYCGDNSLKHHQPRIFYPVKDSLKQLGLTGLRSDSKFVPDVYLRSSREVRLDILRGLMDTDGWAEKNGSVRFSSSSKLLAENVQYLVRSLGGTCSIRKKNTRLVINGIKRPSLDAWVCNIRHDNAQDFFLIGRKRERAVRKSNVVRLNVESIEPCGLEPVQCIAVTGSDRLYVTDEFIVTHNTSLAMQIAHDIAANTCPVLVLSMEMSSTELVSREVSRIGKLPLEEVISGRLYEEDWDRLTYAISRINSLPLIVDEQGGLSISEVRAKARTASRKHGIGLVVVDYLQLMRGEVGTDNRNEQVSQMTRGLKALAKELQLPVICLSQLSRDCEKRSDKRPMPSDLRDSGSIEQDADVILFVYRDEVYHAESHMKGIAEIIIGKQRNGPTGTVYSVFIGERTEFAEMSGPIPTPEPDLAPRRRGM